MQSSAIPPNCGPEERLKIIQEAASLRILAKTLRAKSDELRERNILVVRHANDAVLRSLQISVDILERG